MKWSRTAVVYIAVCSRLAAARSYNICVQCFPFMIDLLRQLQTHFSHFYHRIIKEIYLIMHLCKRPKSFNIQEIWNCKPYTFTLYFYTFIKMPIQLSIFNPAPSVWLLQDLVGPWGRHRMNVHYIAKSIGTPSNDRFDYFSNFHECKS